MAANWIKTAIKRPGALRATAKRAGLLRGEGDTLSMADMAALHARAEKSGDTTLMRRVNMARTLGRMKGK